MFTPRVTRRTAVLGGAASPAIAATGGVAIATGAVGVVGSDGTNHQCVDTKTFVVREI